MTKEIMWSSILEDNLIRAYKTEAVGEYLYQNQGLLDQDTLEFVDFSDEILTLIEDSKWHKEKLEEIFQELDLPIIQYLIDEETDIYKKYFKKTEFIPELVIPNLVRNENLMFDLYKGIKKRTNQDLINKVSNKRNIGFFTTLNTLIESEQSHQDIINNLLSNKEFLEKLNYFEPKEFDEIKNKINKSNKELQNDITKGYRNILFFKTDESVYNELVNNLRDFNNTEIRSKTNIDEKMVFEVETKLNT